MTIKTATISNFDHPFYHDLKKSGLAFFEYTAHEHDFSAFDLIFDFTVLSTDDKIKFINSTSKPVISDLTFNWGELVEKSCPNLIAAMATGIHSPNSCYELWQKSESFLNQVDELFNELKITYFKTDILGFGFVFPRTIAQIINEAYFALEDQLALHEDIDMAMKSGVNYPLGPLEWSHKSGVKNIKRLLDELFQYTGDQRYRPSLRLQMECQSKEKGYI